MIENAYALMTAHFRHAPKSSLSGFGINTSLLVLPAISLIIEGLVELVMLVNAEIYDKLRWVNAFLVIVVGFVSVILITPMGIMGWGISASLFGLPMLYKLDSKTCKCLRPFYIPIPQVVVMLSPNPRV